MCVIEKDTSDPVVCVIDDDELVRTGLKELFESVRLKVLLFNSPSEFLQSNLPDSPYCVVLEVRLPEMSGLQLQEELSRRQIRIPIVFVSGYGDASTAVRAMKAGAVDFLTKPFPHQDLLDAVFAALERDRERRRKETSRAALRACFNSLTAREHQVLQGVAAGKLNKQIAAELGVSEVMVKVHRMNGMRKMHTKSVAELVRMTDSLGLDLANVGPGNATLAAKEHPPSFLTVRRSPQPDHSQPSARKSEISG